ncbi:unnamed protein product [Triticum turgidum subsp. durum]|uniref:Uncharacterized protein n=1 Tax=Triticum turgidum subsp. durum TaxID=4567 RepID=A0A9R0TJ19_TRITD|nr:unnamed protein product [Triticum turgidum subsp. durum]
MPVLRDYQLSNSSPLFTAKRKTLFFSGSVTSRLDNFYAKHDNNASSVNKIKLSVTCGGIFFARGFIKTGLGNRVAYQFVKAFGGSTLGLGYSLVFAEAFLAPAIPSVSARAGGIFLPLVKSLCEACGSRTDDGTERKLGAWLMLTCFQTSVVSSAMFLTAMAANPLAANLTLSTIGQGIGWTLWAKAAIVPGLLSLLIVPLVLYVIYPPEVKTSPDAPRLAKERLAKMGPMSTEEKIMAGTLLLTVGLWIFGGMLSVDAVSAAILGLSVLLITGVVTWKECLAESVAWDTLTWFAALIAMAGYLNKYGLISWFSETVVKFVGGLGLSWQLSFGVLVLMYFYSHYFFASGAAHIGAMFTAFLSVASALGTPPLFAAMKEKSLRRDNGALGALGEQEGTSTSGGQLDDDTNRETIVKLVSRRATEDDEAARKDRGAAV